MTTPAKLGKYEIKRELGRGAMGVVYEGWDPGIGRRVAIKTVRRDQLEGGEAEEMLKRFQREAQAAGRLNHQNIVTTYDFGEDVGADGAATHYIAMEFIDGRELKDVFDANERFALKDIERIMSELLAALGAAHKGGVVHRDIKPANIILLKDGTVKVADFGIARIESSNLTQAGSVLGTPSYMSPEQFTGQPVDGRSDLFSAGVILYQMLTGDKPFSGSLTTIMHRVLKEDPPPPSELNVQIPQAFDGLIRKALAKRPDLRFQTAAEFAEAIRAAISAPAADATVMNLGDATLVGSPPADPDATVARTVVTPPPAAGSATPALAQNVSPAPGSTVEPPRAVSPAPSSVASAKKLPVAALAVGALVVAGGTAAWFALRSPAGNGGGLPTLPTATAPAVQPDGLQIVAVGYADPSDPRYANDKGLLQADLREDARRQAVEKAAAMYLAPDAIAQNYGLIHAKLLARNTDFITAFQDEPAAAPGKDGLIAMTTRATVKVREVQKSLNQMSKDERIDFIRNNGDPKISLSIKTRSATNEGAAEAQASPVAENILKEKIRAFGFRVVDAGNGGSAGEDFAVSGEAKFKKLSAKLEASGIVIEKFVLTSWTVKCIDRKTGEEIYHNTQIPEKQSWATEEMALRDIGDQVGNEFSKNFFLQHFAFSSQAVELNIQGLPGAASPAVLRELQSLRPVLSAEAKGDGRYRVELSGGSAAPSELVTNGLFAPINRKLGKTCLAVTSATGNTVNASFEASCGDTTTVARFETLPPASLLTAPAPRREAVTRNPETLKRIQI